MDRILYRRLAAIRAAFLFSILLSLFGLFVACQHNIQPADPNAPRSYSDATAKAVQAVSILSSANTASIQVEMGLNGQGRLSNRALDEILPWHKKITAFSSGALPILKDKAKSDRQKYTELLVLLAAVTEPKEITDPAVLEQAKLIKQNLEAVKDAIRKLNQ